MHVSPELGSSLFLPGDIHHKATMTSQPSPLVRSNANATALATFPRQRLNQTDDESLLLISPFDDDDYSFAPIETTYSFEIAEDSLNVPYTPLIDEVVELNTIEPKSLPSPTTSTLLNPTSNATKNKAHNAPSSPLHHAPTFCVPSFWSNSSRIVSGRAKKGLKLNLPFKLRDVSKKLQRISIHPTHNTGLAPTVRSASTSTSSPAESSSVVTHDASVQSYSSSCNSVAQTEIHTNCASRFAESMQDDLLEIVFNPIRTPLPEISEDEVELVLHDADTADLNANTNYEYSKFTCDKADTNSPVNTTATLDTTADASPDSLSYSSRSSTSTLSSKTGSILLPPKRAVGKYDPFGIDTDFSTTYGHHQPQRRVHFENIEELLQTRGSETLLLVSSGNASDESSSSLEYLIKYMGCPSPFAIEDGDDSVLVMI